MFTEEMINRVFGFIDPIIQALRVKFPLVGSYAITVYLRTGQYVTFPPQVIANTPFCEMGRKGYARLWEAFGGLLYFITSSKIFAKYFILFKHSSNVFPVAPTSIIVDPVVKC